MQAWDDFLSLQDKELGAAIVNKWLRTLKVTRFDARNLYLEAQNSFQLLWFNQHARDKIKQGLVNNNHQPIKVHIELPGAKTPYEEPPPPPQEKFPKDALDTSATLDNWITVEENETLYELLSALPEETFNPIYFYGPPSSGKTHLLMALARRCDHALYVHANTFTQHMVQAMRTSDMDAFRNTYRNVEILLLDDAHLLAKRAATQEEFFHTFNTLHMANKRIIIAARSSPFELQEIESRLISRFEWGIALPLHPIPSKKWGDILAERCRFYNITIKQDVHTFLLHTFSNSIESLLQALSALIMRTGSALSMVDAPTAQNHLQDLITVEKKEILSLDKIVEATAAHYRVHTEDILGKAQSREYTLPRQIAMYLCRKHLELPFLAIGKAFQRDHSTVISSIRLIEQKLGTPDIHIALLALERALYHPQSH